MKKANIFTLALIILVSFSGIRCGKDFLEKKPISTIGTDDFWKDKSDAASWMAGIYNQLQRTLRTNWTDWGELRSDNFTPSGTSTSQQLLNNSLAGTDGVANWQDLYGTVSLCNYGIKYYPIMIAENRDASAAICRDYLGQCYALRAMMYFYGLRVWGKMPLSTIPVESVAQTVMLPRSSVADVKKQILADIDSALKYVGTDAARRYQIAKAGVYALQTDVYMWNQDYQNALDASIKCETESKCVLVTNPTDWKNIFLDPVSSKETIFNLFWESLEFGGGHGYSSRFGVSGNTNPYRVRASIFDTLLQRRNEFGAANDGRFWNCFDTVEYKSQASWTAAASPACGKFMPWDPNATGITSANRGAFRYASGAECNVKMPVYRFADILLLRAEAYAHLNQHQLALDIVNKIRARVGYPIKAVLSDYTGGDLTEGVERTILRERQIELLCEGKRWFDLCRIGKLQLDNEGYWYLREVMNPLLTRPNQNQFINNASSPNGMGKILFPVSTAAFNANISLNGDQNPPYDQ